MKSLEIELLIRFALGGIKSRQAWGRQPVNSKKDDLNTKIFVSSNIY